MYRLVNNFDGVQRVEDGAFVQAPHGSGWSPAWQAYQDWIASGNAPQPADMPSHNDAIDTQIVAIEEANPITHRALREFVLAVASQFPGASNLPGVQKVAAVDAEIAVLRGERQ